MRDIFNGMIIPQSYPLSMIGHHEFKTGRQSSRKKVHSASPGEPTGLEEAILVNGRGQAQSPLLICVNGQTSCRAHDGPRAR